MNPDARRGADAARLLAEPLLVEAFAVVEGALREAWLATGDAQERERERLWLMAKLLPRVRGYLEEAVSDGRVAVAITDLENTRDAA